VLARIELENVGAVFMEIQAFDESAPDLGEFSPGQPAFKERFLSAGFISEQKTMHAVKPPGVGDVVTDEIEGAGGIEHAASVGGPIR
jgi:hypothetical protein